MLSTKTLCEIAPVLGLTVSFMAYDELEDFHYDVMTLMPQGHRNGDPAPKTDLRVTLEQNQVVAMVAVTWNGWALVELIRDGSIS